VAGFLILKAQHFSPTDRHEWLQRTITAEFSRIYKMSATVKGNLKLLRPSRGA
jgi:hypothetical protein